MTDQSQADLFADVEALPAAFAAFQHDAPVPGAFPLSAADFADHLRQFCYKGQPTVELTESGLRYFVNEFWTAGQRRGHSLHEISYRACFKPQLPAFFIERLTRPGERVYDPFSGRGTTAVEAALLGRAPAANDVNPLSAMLTGPRLAPPSITAIAERLAALDLSAAVPEPPKDDQSQVDLTAFYHPETLRQLTALRAWLLEKPALDPVEAWIRMVALNRLTGHSPGFFSVYTMPPNQAVSAASQRKINEKRGQVPPLRDVRAIMLKKSRGLLADGLPPPHPPAVLMTGPSDAAPALADASVDLVVTSPPFLDVVDYEGDNWLRCWFAGIDPASVRDRPASRHRGVGGLRAADASKAWRASSGPVGSWRSRSGKSAAGASCWSATSSRRSRDCRSTCWV